MQGRRMIEASADAAMADVHGASQRLASASSGDVQTSPVTRKESHGGTTALYAVDAEKSRAKDDKPSALTSEDEAWFQVLPTYLAKFQRDDFWHIQQIESPLCEECSGRQKQAFASVKCLEKECAMHDVPVCAACFQTHHPTEKEQAHRQTLTSACPQCHQDPVAFWCFDCDLSFCCDCFDAIHDDVPRVKNHRRLCTDGTPGSLLVKSKWSPHFRAAVVELITQQRDDSKEVEVANGAPLADLTMKPKENTKPKSSELRVEAQLEEKSSTACEKRKRSANEPEVILIDDDGDTDSESGHTKSTDVTPERSSAKRIHMADGSVARIPSSPADTLAPPASPDWIDTVSIDQDLPASMFSSDVASASSDFPDPWMQRQSERRMLPPSTNHIDLTSQRVSTPSADTAHLWVSPQAPPPMSTSVSQAAEPVTTVATPGLPLNLTENPLEEALYERMEVLHKGIFQTEQDITIYNSRVVQASYQNVHQAHSLVDQVRVLQQRLEQLRKQLDLGVVHIVMQSQPIINRVKMLEMRLLGDIPQVQTASYRKCFNCSIEIKRAREKIASLNTDMDTTLMNVGQMSNVEFHRSVSMINEGIQSHERMIEHWKEERQTEMVRIVQYSLRVRDLLKRAVLQRRNQQDFQQRQQQQQPRQQTQQQSQPQQQYQPPVQPQASSSIEQVTAMPQRLSAQQQAARQQSSANPADLYEQPSRQLSQQAFYAATHQGLTPRPSQ
ncbi:hypothetical protein Poli38472_005744 [Pythium oligandrum]|uniref:B box-type domain-containing protein n=1 Tax=Pythium oligandrum TaxID=41045 RepID=A0A8K1CTD7_PYTOL|nr:hypothetical protein Poli38472_005744 [Pythium oligandrum]|eukprot:TMW68276.1 hypothetical protein Poli38472_005744 [Pythium oligandrum]